MTPHYVGYTATGDRVLAYVGERTAQRCFRERGRGSIRGGLAEAGIVHQSPMPQVGATWHEKR
jgi:hypothetical protein